MVQKATIAVLIAVLVFAGAEPAAAAGPAAPAPVASGPLAPGKPAGAKAAQLERNDVLLIAGAILVVGIGLYLASGTYNIPGQSSGGNGSNAPVTSSP